MNAPEIPNTALAREAHALAVDTHPAVLLAHSERAYRYALAFAGANVDVIDLEVLYVATILHDLGLAQPGTDHFEFVGADATRALVERHSMTASRAQRVWDAIAMHTIPHLPRRRESEVALVQAGSAFDVFGIGRERLDPVVIAEIEAEFPRGDLAGYLRGAFDREIGAHAIGMLGALRGFGLRPV